MGLPASIQAQVDFADQFVEQLNQEPSNDDTPQDPPAEQVVQQPVVAAPQEHSNDAAEDRKWEAKFHTLQGKYNAEVPRLSAQISELNTALRTLVQENKELREKPQVVTAPLPSSVITDADREAFGSDLIDLQERIARQAFQQFEAENRQLQQKIQQLESQLGNVDVRVQESDTDRLLYAVNKLVPDWETINEDPSFLEWLDQTDRVTRVRRQDSLDNAIARRDAQHFADIFNEWKALQPKAPAAPNKSKSGLESQVAPTRTRNTVAPSNAPSGRIWTEADVKQFYVECRRQEHTEEAMASIEADIHAAINEGRYRG